MPVLPMPGTSAVTEMAAQATKVKDVKTAFLQALPTTRVKPPACRLPKDECPEGLDPQQLLLLLTEMSKGKAEKSLPQLVPAIDEMAVMAPWQDNMASPQKRDVYGMMIQND